MARGGDVEDKTTLRNDAVGRVGKRLQQHGNFLRANGHDPLGGHPGDPLVGRIVCRDDADPTRFNQAGGFVVWNSHFLHGFPIPTFQELAKIN
mgnify:CR=1 FL=1